MVKDAGILRGDSSMEEKVVIILNEMSEYLSISQMKKLQEVILKTFSENEAKKQEISNHDFLKMFLDAKKIEGCSERTIQYYKVTVEHLLSKIEESVRKITTEEIRAYLADYQKWNNCSNVTIDNIRRNISSFFSWLEEEDYILKSPMRRIHKIKTKTVVKSVITDEGIERLRDNCMEKRDLAIIDLLYSTGIRVGELVNLNIDDIDLEGRECIVYGKGDKERQVFNFLCLILYFYHQISHMTELCHINIKCRLGWHILFPNKVLQKIFCLCHNPTEQIRKPAFAFN